MRWFEDFRKIVLMNILYMWKHSGIEDTVFGIIFTIVLLFEGRKGTCMVCVDEWLDIVCVVRPRVNENVSIVVISICIS